MGEKGGAQAHGDAAVQDRLPGLGDDELRHDGCEGRVWALAVQRRDVVGLRRDRRAAEGYAQRDTRTSSGK